ncbi:MAG: hypothetical protein DLM73_03000 [Chthoniobacterales bacterium]|nr:MAG: hypothetical protein DLM73_03000 [Chthoniobacterales bacterium]
MENAEESAIAVAPRSRSAMVPLRPETLTLKKMLNRLAQFCALGALLAGFTGCGTVSDLVTSHVPERHSGRPSIVVNLQAQEAYLFRGKNRTATSRISSGREGHRTPIGRFAVIRKDLDHRSSLYGSYVDDSGKVVKGNVDSRKDSKPQHSHFVGAPMPYFLEFSPGYGLHQGYLPGVPASHGCIRMPYWKARQFFDAARVGTPVAVKP